MTTTYEARPKESLIIQNYPGAFGDTYGVIGDFIFLYKTGPTWFQERHTWRYEREIRPVDHHHPIKPKWRSVLRGIVAHFKQPHINIPINIISGLAFGNQGNGVGQPKETFCELIVVIGILPVNLDYDFEKIKEAAEYVQKNVISEAGFPDVHVAVREWEYHPSTSASASSRTSEARLLPSLDDKLGDLQIMGFSHPFTTNPGLAVALLDKPTHEGTVGVYLQLKDSDSQGVGRSKILGLTCCHTASPLSAATGLSIAHAEAHPEYIITPGEAAYEKGIRELIGHIGTLRSRLSAWEKELEQLLQQPKTVTHNTKDQPSTSNTNSGYTPRSPLESAHMSIKYDTGNLNELSAIQERVAALSLDEAQNRRIGRVYYADPISASSEDPFDAYSVDWALIEFDEGAFGEGFTGNKVFIGSTDEPYQEYMKQRSICSGRSKGLRSVLQIPTQWVRSKKDALAGEHRDDKYGTNRVAVVKNGAATGTTFGWLNGLESYVRHTILPEDSDGGAAGGGGEPIVFESMETTILPLGADHRSFSESGDSGSAILDSEGRFVAMLTGVGSMNGFTDITFGTAAWRLMPRIMKAVPGVELCPAVERV